MIDQNNFFAIFFTIGWVFVFLFLSEAMAHYNKMSKENARKLIHISVGNVIFFIPFYEGRFLAVLIPFIFIFGNYLLSPVSPIKKIQLKTFEAGHSFGTVYYALALTIIVYMFYDHPFLIIAAFFPVAYGDGFAAVIGPKYQSKKFFIRGNQKTIYGTLAMFVATFSSILIGGFLLTILDVNFISSSDMMIVGLTIAVIATFLELISPTGTDNIVIPIGLSFILLLIENRIY